MNALRLTAVATTLSVAVLGALMTPAANAQAVAPTQRLEITGKPATWGWVRSGDDWIPDVPFFGLRTLAEVIAEMHAWKAAGEMVYSGDEWLRRDRFVSTKRRAEVMADAAASRARGDVVRVGDEMFARHVAEQIGAVAFSSDSKTQNAAATTIGNAR